MTKPEIRPAKDIVKRARLPGRTPAKNIAAKPPTRKREDENGLVLVEKLCPIPHARKMVDPDGNIVMVPLANGFGRPDPGANYGNQILQRKLNDGFLPYDECPVQTGRLKRKGEKPCDGDFSDEKCCKHVEEIAHNRRSVKQRKNAQFAEKLKTSNEKLVESVYKQAQNATKEKEPGGNVFGG